MLPKDILKYARKFSPAEIESAIKQAIDAVGKTIRVGMSPDSIDWRTLQDAVREQVGLVPASWWKTFPIGTTIQPYTTTTTTNAYSTYWTPTTTTSNYTFTS